MPGTTSLSVMVTVAVEGVPRVAPPVGPPSVTPKVFDPLISCSSVTGTLIVFTVLSPAAQFSVPLLAV